MTAPTRKFLIASSALIVAGLCTGLIAYYGGLPMGAFARGDRPDELSYVPANAAVVGFADVREVMSSELRQKLRAVMPPEDKGREEFKAQTGIDIETDIDHVVACMVPGGESKNSGFVVLRGRFDTVKLEALAREHNAVVEDYKGIRVVRLPERENDAEQQAHRHGRPALAFAAPGVIIVGEEAALKQAIDTHASGRSIVDNADVMKQISAIEGGANAWAVGRLDVLAAQAKLPEQVAAQVPAVSWFAVAGHVNGGMNGTVRAEARDEASAKNLRDVINGFLALARMQAGSKPQLQALVQSVTLSGSGNTVQLDFTVPAELFDAIPQLKGHVNGAAH